MDSSVVASPADLLATIPVAPLVKSGDLKLADGRLTFTSPGGVVMLDAPVAEVHSVAKAATGIHLWHHRTRFRFAFGKANPTRADSWVSTLTPVMGQPPAGLRVRRPWPSWAWVASMIGVVIMLMAIATIIQSVAK
ncbi:MAG TPA: hypothetical protein VGM78_11515 [Ilumatobacteraceae bacterium]|jgi:hypothetical protein